MPIYLYKGIDINTGAKRKGTIESENMKAAKTKLKQKEKVFVSDIKEEASVDGKSAKKSFFQNLSDSIEHRVSKSDLSVMTRQFATLQKASIPVDESVRALSQQVDNVMLRNTLAAVKEKISEGISLADSLAKYPKIFNKLYVNMVKAGESSGTLGLVLERLADYLEYQVEMKGKILSAITYPLVMMFASFGIIIFLFVRIVPKLVKVFANLKVKLPWYTKFTIGISNVLQHYWIIIIISLVVIIYLFKRWVSSEEGRRKFDRFILKVPVLGDIVLRLMMSQFTKTLSTMLSSGVPIIQALDITKNVITNSVISDILEDSKVAVQEGQSLGHTIEKSKRFPPLVTQMIYTGERTGQLESMLSHVAIAYDAEVERKISALISIIEPFMTIIMAGTTVLVIFALLMPMMSMMGQLR